MWMKAIKIMIVSWKVNNYTWYDSHTPGFCLKDSRSLLEALFKLPLLQIMKRMKKPFTKSFCIGLTKQENLILLQAIIVIKGNDKLW